MRCVSCKEYSKKGYDYLCKKCYYNGPVPKGLVSDRKFLGERPKIKIKAVVPCASCGIIVKEKYKGGLNYCPPCRYDAILARNRLRQKLRTEARLKAKLQAKARTV